MRYDQDQAPTSHPHQHPTISEKTRGPPVAGTVMKVPSLRPTLQDPTTCQAPTTPATAHGPRPPPPEGEEVSTGEPARGDGAN
jgi:hypothetical protein